MKGYVKNISPTWRHAMKRSIGPGHEIALDELFDQYGEKHNLSPDESFIRWLRQVKLQDASIWFIHYEQPTNETAMVEDQSFGVTPDAPMGVSPMNPVNDELMNIINLSVRQAREYLDKITDLRLLREAYRQANQLADKRTLCLEINKRIKALEVSRR